MPPTRSKVFSCSTRKSFACMGRLSSPTSSRKMEPPSAISKRPLRIATAPVNEPFSWPNSSLSTMFSGSAAQLNLMNGPSAVEAVIVEGVGDKLLADAAFAEDQHGRLRARHLVDELVDLLHRLGIADDVGGLEALFQRIVQAAVLVLKANLLDVLHEIELDRRRDHGGDGRDQLHILLQKPPVV